MLMSIRASIGAFMNEHCGTIMFVGMILLIIAEVAQFIVNSSLEEELIDLVERVEVLEKMNDINGMEGETAEKSEEE